MGREKERNISLEGIRTKPQPIELSLKGTFEGYFIYFYMVAWDYSRRSWHVITPKKSYLITEHLQPPVTFFIPEA